jgi:hypothetical protein
MRLQYPLKAFFYIVYFTVSAEVCRGLT